MVNPAVASVTKCCLCCISSHLHVALQLHSTPPAEMSSANERQLGHSLQQRLEGLVTPSSSSSPASQPLKSAPPSSSAPPLRLLEFHDRQRLLLPEVEESLSSIMSVISDAGNILSLASSTADGGSSSSSSSEEAALIDLKRLPSLLSKLLALPEITNNHTTSKLVIDGILAFAYLETRYNKFNDHARAWAIKTIDK
jgi:hypothetical protein